MENNLDLLLLMKHSAFEKEKRANTARFARREATVCDVQLDP